MGQEFHVVRCFSCQSFQVHQVKKASRWSCKLCGEKQSLLKEFGRGSAADCRRHVQKLNATRGAVMEEQERQTWSLWEQQAEEAEQRDKRVRPAQVSRWSKYLNTPEEAGPEEEAEPEEKDLVNRKQLDGNKVANRKRKSAEEAGPEDGHTPEQLNCPKSQTPSATTTCSPAPCFPASRWSHFLSSDCKAQEKQPAVGGAVDPSCPLLPASSMFESGEEFNFDDDFLTQV